VAYIVAYRPSVIIAGGLLLLYVFPANSKKAQAGEPVGNHLRLPHRHEARRSEQSALKRAEVYDPAPE
jgi:hypothetical protein